MSRTRIDRFTPAQGRASPTFPQEFEAVCREIANLNRGHAQNGSRSEDHRAALKGLEDQALAMLDKEILGGFYSFCFF